MSDLPFFRAPVVKITADPVVVAGTLSKSHTGAIAGGAIGGAAALLVIGAIALVVLRRRRRVRRRKSFASSFERDVVEPDLSLVVTPFDPSHAEEAETNWQRQWTGPEAIPLTSTPLDSSPRAVPVPVGWSSKDLARLREEKLHSSSSSIDRLLSGPNTSITAIPESGPSTSLTATPDVTSSSEARRLQSEVDSLRLEMQQLRTERFEAPPLYEDGDEQ